MSLENKLQDKTKKEINCIEKWYSVGKMTVLRKHVFYQKRLYLHHVLMYGTWVLFEKFHW